MTTGWDDLELSIAREFMNLEEFRIHGFSLRREKKGNQTFSHGHIQSFAYIFFCV